MSMGNILVIVVGVRAHTQWKLKKCKKKYSDSRSRQATANSTAANYTVQALTPHFTTHERTLRPPTRPSQSQGENERIM